AWIIQLKNTLAMVWYLMSILFYLTFDDWKPATDVPVGDAASVRSRFAGGAWYCLSLFAFLLAVLSKGSVATLPAILLAIVWWQCGLTKRDLVRLAPFFALAATFVIVNVWFQAHANSETIRHATMPERILGAAAVIWFYLYKALAPFDLAI